MKQLKIFTLLLLVAFSLSCSKESDDSSVIGDAIIVSKRSGTDVVYGVALYAYAYSPLKTVSAVSSLELSNAVSLAANGSYTYNFIKEPTDSEYSGTIPVASIYTFNGVFESGATFECQDILSSDALAPVTFEKCQYNTTDSYAEFSWTALTNAYSYVIYIVNESGTVVFGSSMLSNTVTAGNISSSANGWSSGYPIKGATYIVRIYAFAYEDSLDVDSYQLQATSISEATLVWGE